MRCSVTPLVPFTEDRDRLIRSSVLSLAIEGMPTHPEIHNIISQAVPNKMAVKAKANVTQMMI